MKEIQELVKELRNVATRCNLDDDYDLNDCAEDIREIANTLEKAVEPTEKEKPCKESGKPCKESLQVGNAKKKCRQINSDEPAKILHDYWRRHHEN